jgi:hypothetical protein
MQDKQNLSLMQVIQGETQEMQVAFVSKGKVASGHCFTHCLVV